MELVAVDRAGSVTTVTMVNQRKLNSLGSPMVAEMIAAITAAGHDGTRVLVIRAEPGCRTWSAGHDVNELPTDGGDPLLWTAPLEKLLRAVHNAPFPVIAAVTGGVWGGACDLVSTSDLVVATQSATFAITPAKMGIPYNTVGVSHFLNTLPLHVIKEMFFTANPISAALAAQHGLVNRLVADEAELEAATAELAERIALLAPLVITALKTELGALTDARPMTPDVFENLQTRRQAAWRSDDYAEGIRAFRERRVPVFTGR
jgi:methylmalonyl-CoA decarboxylase